MPVIVEDRRNRGSITAEASIIAPVVIICIAAAVYMGLLLHQKTEMQAAAESAAEAGAMAWAAGGGMPGTADSDIPGTGKLSESEGRKFDLYRRLFDSGREQRLANIENYASELAGRNELIKPVKTTVTAELNDYVIYKRISVSISKSYKNPLGGLFVLVGAGDTIDIKTSAVSTVDEPAELIRTADFVLDIEKKLEDRFPDLKNIADKTRSTMSDMKNKLSEFID